MKRLIVFLMVLGLCSAAFAGQGRIHKVFDAVPLIAHSDGTNSTTYSTIYPVSSSGYFGVWIDLTTLEPVGAGAHTPKVDISCQMSYDTTAANFATPTSMSLVADEMTSTAPTVVSMSPAPMKYMRFMAEGVAGSDTVGNTTNTTITMYLFSQDE